MHSTKPADNILDTARRYHEAGLAVIPPMENGTKRPLGTWKEYQLERPTPAVIKGWYSNGREGIGTLTGKVASNLELFEFDDHSTYLAFKEVAEATGIGTLVERIEGGYSETTPGGGVHWYYRCPTISGNTKLAQRLKTPQEMKDPNDKVKTVIETRGEGGFSVMAPSGGRVHPTGRPYEVLAGSVENIVTITPEERKLLWDLARTFHELHQEERGQQAQSSSDEDDRPGDVFNKETTWPDILEPHGWKKVFTRGAVTHWRRPGKNIGTSATTGFTKSDTLMVFSSSTEFEVSPASYSKFGAYAVLNHKGDHGAAARELWEKNTPRADRPGRSWGSTSEPTAEPVPAELPPAPAYPVDALSPIVRTYVLEAAASLDIQPDMIATAILPIAAAVLGNGVSIELKRGWSERPQLWAANVGEPGSAKSPAARAAMVGINALQAAAHKQYREAWECYEQDVASWAAAKPAARGPKPHEPSEQHFFSSDATIEAVATMLMGATRGLLLEHDELSGWVRGMDAYKAAGKGKERQQHLQLWDGKEVKVDRKGNPSIYLENPVVAVVGGIQPDKLADITRGQRDGFPDRVLWCWPQSEVVGWTEEEVSDSATEAYVELFARLSRLTGKYRFSPEAKAAWVAWSGDNVAILKQEEDAMRGMAAKLPRQLARVALILHCLGTQPAPEVSADTILGAIAIIEYHRSMARRVLGGSGPARQASVRERVLRILGDATGDEVCSFVRLFASSYQLNNSSLSNYPVCLSTRELTIRLGGRVPAADLGPTLDALVAEGLVLHHETEPGPRGGRPGFHFRLSVQRTNEQTEQTRSSDPCKNGCGYFLFPGDACSDCGEVAS